ncbi:cob(I)yrinic acid a,c-diamide adenosyltransferase [Echinicola strongylocentroti]|uniref:Corrinoid adenosyltransferase n=1 Tax=Echinicola strongylocentroti TaxID=1795355 RepID=A0A2Z4IL59_9BACT|nr:cob(I)yrinic acid a,c-diamide adenosyltransferase [Echinicola strongylocentroti]AWW31624.1 cob(I)yrinic acid a,c-diamide adenosyltransferase [Echinicola strongylocentroti]
MKLYTKGGDQGQTSLLGGSRVSKADLRIEAYGTIDELNAFLGLLKDQEVNQKRSGQLKTIQDRLFTIGADLATEQGNNKVKKPDILEEDVTYLEREIDLMEEKLPALKKFILPGGHSAISYSHVARTVCRRAERRVTALHSQEAVDEIIIKYLNRLSDYLFVLGRMIAIEVEVKEITWESRV